MSILSSISEAAKERRRVQVPLAGGKNPPRVWFTLRRPDSVAMARAGRALLLTDTRTLADHTRGVRDDGEAKFAGNVALVCASVVGVSETADGDDEPCELVTEEARQDAAAGRMYVGHLPMAAFAAITKEAFKLLGEEGEALARFRAE